MVLLHFKALSVGDEVSHMLIARFASRLNGIIEILSNFGSKRAANACEAFFRSCAFVSVAWYFNEGLVAPGHAGSNPVSDQQLQLPSGLQAMELEASRINATEAGLILPLL